MNIQEFISKYRNHPVLFVGTGISLRYLKNSYTWDGLLKHVSFELKGNTEYYLDIKSKCEMHGRYDYPQIASHLEEEFNNSLITDRNGKFKVINDSFYKQMNNGVNLSRLKIFISNLFLSIEIKEEMKNEVAEFMKVRKNIGSIITTNYDSFIEGIFKFHPLVGNDILLSNPYGSVYKIHGCVNQPSKIIITNDDYKKFYEKYELIRAQLLSIFIHNPIIFMGYGIGDDNIKSLLKTIFTYIEPNSEDAKRIRDNFLLIEYEAGSNSQVITEHDIDLEGFSTIRINKIKTDNFVELYKALSNLELPVSAMDIRKVQNIVKELNAGGHIKVKITEYLDSLDNSDKIIAIGSHKTITYTYQSSSEMMSNYFNIIDESNSQLLTLINHYKIQPQQFFPIFGFSKICEKINNVEHLKTQQVEKNENTLRAIKDPCKTKNTTISDIYDDKNIADTNKAHAIFWSLIYSIIMLDDAEQFLRSYKDKSHTNYRKLLSAYDFVMYGGLHYLNLII